jgi:hypothetical protein
LLNDHALLRTYYLSTPVFILIDVLWGAPLRAAFGVDLGLRLAYYALCLGCAGLILYRPSLTSLVAMGESVVNLTLLIFGVMGPILSVSEETAESGAIGFASPMELINFVLVGGILLATYYRNQTSVAEKLARRTTRPFPQTRRR